MADKLGIRLSGRPIIRPAPDEEQTDLALEVGAVVDAWWSDGWWEGVVTGFEDYGDYVRVFTPGMLIRQRSVFSIIPSFPYVFILHNVIVVVALGESLLLKVHKKDLRISREWLGDQWINIEAKPHVVSVVSATFVSGSKPSLSSAIGKDVKSDGLASSSIEAPVSTDHDIVEEENLNGTASASSDGLLKIADWVNGDKSPSLKDSGPEDDGVNPNDSCGNIEDIQGNDDDNKDDHDHDDGRASMEVLEMSGQSCKAVEVMEVTA